VRSSGADASVNHGVPLTVIPLVHGIELPAVRLWDVIV
jgi:hypothetical protein